MHHDLARVAKCQDTTWQDNTRQRQDKQRAAERTNKQNLICNINKRPGVWEWAVCVRVMLSIVHSPCCGENTSAHMGQFLVQIHVFPAKECTNENYTTWPRNKNNTKIGLSSDNTKQHNVGKSRVQSGVLCDSFNTTPPTPLPLHSA